MSTAPEFDGSYTLPRSETYLERRHPDESKIGSQIVVLLVQRFAHPHREATQWTRGDRVPLRKSHRVDLILVPERTLIVACLFVFGKPGPHSLCHLKNARSGKIDGTARRLRSLIVEPVSIFGAEGRGSVWLGRARLRKRGRVVLRCRGSQVRAGREIARPLLALVCQP